MTVKTLPWYGRRNQRDYVKLDTDGSVTTLNATADEVGAYFWFDEESCGVHEYQECTENDWNDMKLRVLTKLLTL